MALDSQSQRRNSGMTHTSSFRRRNRGLLRLVGLVVVLGLVGALAYHWIARGRTTDAIDLAPASPATGSAPGETVANPAAPSPSTPPTAQNLAGSAPPTAPVITTATATPTPPTPATPVAPPPAPATASSTPAAPTTPTTPTTPANSPSAEVSPEFARLLEQGKSLESQGKLLEARTALNQALRQASLSADAQAARDEITKVNQTLVFSSEVLPGDPWTQSYTIGPGDNLTRLAAGGHVPWEFIARINNNLNPRRLRVGQRVKLIKGPFNVVVHKNAFRLDVYLGDPAGPDSTYVRSFRIGLGVQGSTPVGQFIVRAGSKLVNPDWTNPRTGERISGHDPKNPLGPRWVGLRGIDPNTTPLKGYGIHGTIEPDSIGTEASMGCVRLLPADIIQLYAMLEPEASHVTIMLQ